MRLETDGYILYIGNISPKYDLQIDYILLSAFYMMLDMYWSIFVNII